MIVHLSIPLMCQFLLHVFWSPVIRHITIYVFYVFLMTDPFNFIKWPLSLVILPVFFFSPRGHGFFSSFFKWWQFSVLFFPQSSLGLEVDGLDALASHCPFQTTLSLCLPTPLHSCLWYSLFFSSILFFYWSIVDFQCCANLCCTAKWLSYTHIDILFLYSFPLWFITGYWL